ncbi:ATP-binding cassette domain-containing protein [Paenibacillus sediminis]|uniref:ABC-2 type transport system ATP-binding protein n=1 Tax=Paenibacillus sediminis TaxID=664909 RepID=A0ABS4H378_9BACL|nr:ATP-binding cassette domain-containing protein [Paenibacillus sediminis]MBP1936984.1 ABC-2 type transport system ATP-binding protein [Paenibacillus sediminis]
MIEVKDLSKDYIILKRKPGLSGAIRSLFIREKEIKQAVDHISFEIKPGEVVGYIGPNGAGKSTTIKMLCGILTPSHGEIRVNGVVPYQNRKQNAINIGAVYGQRTQLFWDIPVRESYELLRHIYEIPKNDFEARMKHFTEYLNLGPILDIPVRQLSLGQKMRCELAASFLHNPAVVFLDEPTIGLDVAVKENIRKFIREMNHLYGTTVILTTHDMEDIEQLCQRIIIIDNGSILYDGDLVAVKERFGHQRTIHFEMPQTDHFKLPASLESTVDVAEITESRVSLLFSSRDIKGAEVIAIMMAEYEVNDLTIKDTSIETIVKEIYERGI